jgi:hypothetical protein
MSREPSFAGTNHKILQFMFYVTMFLAMSILSDSSEPPSKSVVSTWCENIGYRFFGGPYRVTVFCSNQHSIKQQKLRGKRENKKNRKNK